MLKVVINQRSIKLVLNFRSKELLEMGFLSSIVTQSHLRGKKPSSKERLKQEIVKKEAPSPPPLTDLRALA